MPDSYYDINAPVSWWNVLAQFLVVDFFVYINHRLVCVVAFFSNLYVRVTLSLLCTRRYTSLITSLPYLSNTMRLMDQYSTQFLWSSSRCLLRIKFAGTLPFRLRFQRAHCHSGMLLVGTSSHLAPVTRAFLLWSTRNFYILGITSLRLSESVCQIVFTRSNSPQVALLTTMYITLFSFGITDTFLSTGTEFSVLSSLLMTSRALLPTLNVRY